MDTFGDPSTPYFYLHLPVINELRVLVPFTTFKVGFLATINVAPSQITTNIWSMLRDFEIVCCSMGVSPVVRVYLTFFST